MVEYKCKKCNKVFNHLGNYNTHIMRVFPCDEKKEEKKEKKEIPIENESDGLECKYCKKTFSRRDVCTRHEKYNCKNTKTVINNFQTVNNFNTINNIQQNFN